MREITATITWGATVVCRKGHPVYLHWQMTDGHYESLDRKRISKKEADRLMAEARIKWPSEKETPGTSPGAAMAEA